MGPGLSEFVFGKSSKNTPIPVLIFWSSTMLKVVSYYDLSVLSMSVMGFQKRSLDVGWVDLKKKFNFAKPLSTIPLLPRRPLGTKHFSVPIYRHSLFASHLHTFTPATCLHPFFAIYLLSPLGATYLSPTANLSPPTSHHH